MGDRLQGKVAIVTGAGSTAGAGIGNGKASAIVYAREGASVVLVDLNEETAGETKHLIDQEGGESIVVQADVSQSSDCQTMVDLCLEKYGRVDILHNNVGIEPETAGGILTANEESWDRLIDINLKSMFLTTRAAIPAMSRGGNGVILNISSVSAERFGPKDFLYSISKAGVNALTRSVAMDYADKGIRSNAIMPGLMDTPMVERHKDLYGGDLEKMKQARRDRVPMKREGEAWDIAYASLFLVSDEAKYITGQVLAVDGGLLCKI